MNPILSTPRRLVLYALAWALAGALVGIAVWRTGVTPVGPAFVLAVPLTIVYGFICLSSWYVCRVTPIRRSRFLLIATNCIGAALLSSALWVLLGRGWAMVLPQVITDWPVAGADPRVSSVLFVAGVLLYALATAVNYAIVGFEESTEAERRALELQVLAREAELKTLRAQVDPHFLFNTLHSISALTGIDPAAAQRMCVLLGDFLRTTVRVGGEAHITLADELMLADRFLEIEQVRFGTRLAVERDVDLAAGPCPLPPLLLQPIVENAVTHGIGHLLDGGTVRLQARCRDGAVEVVVENPCDPERPKRPRTGVGLANVRKRLAAQFGGQALVEAQESDGAFRVRVVIPWNAPAS